MIATHCQNVHRYRYRRLESRWQLRQFDCCLGTDFIQNNGPMSKPAQKTGRANCRKVTFKWIAETDEVDLLPGLMFEKACLARLARDCDQYGRKASKGLLQGWCELTLLHKTANNKIRFSFC